MAHVRKIVPIQLCVGFYPGSSWERHSPNWSNYNGKSAMIHCAESDGTSAAPGIQEAIKKISQAGGAIQVFDYVGTQHAFFNNDPTELFNAEAAKLAWDSTISLLK